MASTVRQSTSKTKPGNTDERVEPARAKTKRASQWTRLSEGGRLVIPAEMREALGIEPGAKLLLELNDGVVTVRTFAGAMRHLDELLAPYFPKEGSLVDELIRERREEAARE